MLLCIPVCSGIRRRKRDRIQYFPVDLGILQCGDRYSRRSELQRLCDVADRELHNDGADRSERSRISCVA